MHTTRSTLFDEFFHDLLTSLDIEAIQQQWESLQSPYEVDKWLLPLPLWAKRPYDDSGIKAWQVLQGDMRQGHSDNAMCIYLHIPFCSSKCGFCDSYSFKLGSHTQEHIDKYLERLCAEIDLWSGQGNLSQRRISTVHMGGGTPTFIGEAGLHRITNHLREHFQTNDSTEWALESTVDALTPSMIKVMHDLGYRRLHVGVQSLEDEVRRIIGRRCVSKDVLQVIENTLALGWVVSVDLICGLPSQTLDGFLTGIQDLIDIGVNGFSIYELLIYPQNHKWAKAHGLTDISHIPNYFLFLAGACLLESRGFTKNLFNHWADQRDENIYFTFPTRGEDCLAMGTIADGVMGDYHYRHPRYADYMHLSRPDFPGLQGGLRKNAIERRMHPIVTAILSAQVPDALLYEQTKFSPAGLEQMIDRWLGNRLVEQADDGVLRLTASGSWFAGNLIADCHSLARESGR